MSLSNLYFFAVDFDPLTYFNWHLFARHGALPALGLGRRRLGRDAGPEVLVDLLSGAGRELPALPTFQFREFPLMTSAKFSDIFTGH